MNRSAAAEAAALVHRMLENLIATSRESDLRAQVPCILIRVYCSERRNTLVALTPQVPPRRETA
ncbi:MULTISPECIES: hypothetical protein [Bradyrhizobium]|uniref:Uncharacterized protein n=1 Tax=Bradyrhizobium ottawaense TaxID=931866 RepID=A0ABV4FJ08_9BRAD|nr:hypothetical protein [Bradyrhizobium sp. CCBAU 15615]